MAEPKYVGEIKATLATLVERSVNTYKLCEKLEQHQAIQNGRVTKLTIGLVSLVSLLVGLGILEAQDVIRIFGG